MDKETAAARPMVASTLDEGVSGRASRNLYFQRSNGQYLLIKENISDEQEALKEISAFCERHNYKSYYTRMWTNADETTFDVGSWSEFFKLAPVDSHFADKIVGTEKDFIDKKI